MNDTTHDDGNQTRTNTVFIVVTAVISPLMLSAVIINLLIIVSILKFKRLQIPANFILMNLSVADCSVAAAALMYLCMNDFLEGIMCVLTMGFGFLTFSASLLSLALIAYDRFSALVKPLTYSSRLTNKRIILYVAIIWVYATFVTVIPLFVLEMVPEKSDNPMMRKRTILCFKRPSSYHFLLCQVCLVCLPGASMMFYCYGRVMLVARHHSRAISAVQGNLRKSKFNKTYGMFRGKKYFVTLSSILGVFSGTWGLFVALILVACFCQECFKVNHLSRDYFCILPLLSVSINPWIYTCRSQDFKAAFMRLYKSAKLCCKGERPPSNRTRRDSRFSDGLSRTNSMIGNMQHLQALYSDAYYKQKIQNNTRPTTCPPSLTVQSVSKSVQSIQPKADPCQVIGPLGDPS
ncbi:5-hydroxytryptamine receptor 1F-like [Apostichopus japonicus]|uniref:5-hydroxytryptamine receptor 1F-like n=1 Tax=Stichopus japonicus TaxID=307972 RepID=UPI003AB428BF